jgi:hydroxymethylglutaryl-CoA lyase
MDQVKLVEVGPRDGLQNEPVSISTDDKLEMIRLLTETGLKTIEITSFVHPKWIPQLADAVKVASKVERSDRVHYTALVPNRKGLDRALEAKMNEVAIFISASETHNQSNINKPIDETLAEFAEVTQEALRHGIKVRAYISMVFGCPFEGHVPIGQVARLTERLFQMGVYEISYGDTVGMANPKQVKQGFSDLSGSFPVERMAGHFHDTRGTGLVNLYAAMEAGVCVFDSSIGGLGGCPYAPGASGNIATEDVVYMLHGMGIDTGVDLGKLVEASVFLQQKLGRPLPSKVLQAVLAQKEQTR